MQSVAEKRKLIRRREKKILILLFSGAGLLLLGIVGLIFMPSPSDSAAEELPSAVPVEVNYPAPDISLISLDGNPVSLKDYRGQTIMVNNWATWCPPCKAEMPDLNTYYLKHRDQNFTLIGIEAGDTAENIARIIDQFTIEYPIWLDPSEDALYAFQTSYLPSTFVINPEGVVRLQWTGAITLSNLEKYVTPLLENE